MQKKEVEQFFLKRMRAENRCLTAAQQKVVMTILNKTPMPIMGMLMVDQALEWTSDTAVSSSDLPNTVEDALAHLCKQAEAVVGKECVLRILGYLGRSK